MSTAASLVPGQRTGSARASGPLRFVSRITSRTLLYVVLTLGMLVLIAPMGWMVSSSLKEEGDIYAYPPVLIPDPPRWANYAEAVQKLDFLNMLKNSLIITVVPTIGTTMSASIVAFGFARHRFPGRGLLFTVLLATMMLPGIVTLIPTFVLFHRLGWVNTYFPLTLPYFLGGGAFNIFLLRQFYGTLPYDYDEAAYIDGASVLQVWWRILVPLSKAPLATIAVFTIVGCWNDFMGPLIYMNAPHLRTLSVGLQQFREVFYTRWNLILAGSVLMTLPITALFFGAQRYFLQGILMTGLTGR